MMLNDFASSAFANYLSSQRKNGTHEWQRSDGDGKLISNRKLPITETEVKDVNRFEDEMQNAAERAAYSELSFSGFPLKENGTGGTVVPSDSKFSFFHNNLLIKEEPSELLNMGRLPKTPEPILSSTNFPKEVINPLGGNAHCLPPAYASYGKTTGAISIDESTHFDAPLTRVPAQSIESCFPWMQNTEKWPSNVSAPALKKHKFEDIKHGIPPPLLPGPARTRVAEHRIAKYEKLEGHEDGKPTPCSSSSTEEANFSKTGLAQYPSWLYALLLFDFPFDKYHLGLTYEASGCDRPTFLCHYNIRHIMKTSDAPVEKVKFLMVLVKSTLLKTVDPMFLVVDPTGHIPACCHSSTWTEHSKNFHPGATLVLRNVTVYRAMKAHPYLLITSRSLVRIIPAKPLSSELKRNIEIKLQSERIIKQERKRKVDFDI